MRYIKLLLMILITNLSFSQNQYIGKSAKFVFDSEISNNIKTYNDTSTAYTYMNNDNMSTTKIYFENKICFQVEIMVDDSYEITYNYFSKLFKWEKSNDKHLPNVYLFEKDGILFQIEKRQSDLTVIWIFAKK
jgi:hypothetical protein